MLNSVSRRLTIVSLVIVSIAEPGSSILAEETRIIESKSSNVTAEHPLDFAMPDLRVRSENRKILERIENERVSIKVEDTPLSQVAEMLSKQVRIPIALDELSLEEAGLSVDMDVSLDVTEVRLESAFDRLIEFQELEWFAKDERIIITTMENGWGHEFLETQVFAVGDIVRWLEESTPHNSSGGLGGGEVRQQGFLFGSQPPTNLLTGLIVEYAGGMWVETHASGGTLNYEGGVLVVRHNRRVLTTVDRFLSRLRLLKSRPPSTAMWMIPERCFGWPENQKCLDALQNSGVADFTGTPLNRALGLISKQMKIQIDLDSIAIEEAGLDVEEPIDLVMKGTFHSILRRMLADWELIWLIRDDTLFVTTIESANAQLQLAVVDVRELLATEQFTEDGLMDFFMYQTGGLWIEHEGAYNPIRNAAGLFVFRQTQEVLSEIAVLIHDLKTTSLRADAERIWGTDHPRRVRKRPRHVRHQVRLERILEGSRTLWTCRQKRW